MEEATDAYEQGRADIAASWVPTPTSWSSPRTPPRPSTWCHMCWGQQVRPCRRPGRRRRHHRLEHHANLIPWQELCRRTGAELKWFGVDGEGRIDIDSLELDSRVKVVAFSHHSNVTGTIAPVQTLEMRRAQAVGAADRPGRLPVGATPAGRLPRPRRRLRGVLRAQDARPHRHRSPLRPARTARCHAAVSHRRLDDRDGDDGERHLCARPAALRGRARR